MSRALALSTVLLALALWCPAQAGVEQDKAESISTQSANNKVVAGPIPEKVTSSTAVVWWQTTKPAESILVYGLSADAVNQRVEKPWATETHEISLRKLQPNTTYYIAVLEPNGSPAASGQFTTQPVGYTQQASIRITNGPLFEQITANSATIAWSTNMPSSAEVHYGTDLHNLDQTVEAPWAPATHHVVLHDLRPDTHYYFAIGSSQESGAGQTSPQIYAFQTLSQGEQALNIGPGR